MIRSLPPPTLERETEVLGRGLVDLDVPIMTLYTAAHIPGETVNTSVSWAVRSIHGGPSTTYVFQWSLLSQASLPVRFVLNSTFSNPNLGIIPSGAVEDGFLYQPAGACAAGCTSTGLDTGLGGPGVQYVYYAKWRLNYTVLSVTEGQGSARVSFLEVDFWLKPMETVGSPMPAANVSKPGPQELAPFFSATLPAESSISVSVQGQTFVPNLFRHNGTTVAFDAGRLGSLGARLGSQYRWSSADDYRLSFSASTDTSIQLYVDLRFGSLLLEYAPHSE